jgi:hypothetical protein
MLIMSFSWLFLAIRDLFLPYLLLFYPTHQPMVLHRRPIPWSHPSPLFSSAGRVADRVTVLVTVGRAAAVIVAGTLLVKVRVKVRVEIRVVILFTVIVDKRVTGTDRVNVLVLVRTDTCVIV